MPKRKHDKKQAYDDIIKEAERYHQHFIRNPIAKKYQVKRVSRILDKAYGKEVRKSKKRR